MPGSESEPLTPSMISHELSVRPAITADAEPLARIWVETIETLGRLDPRFRAAPAGAERWRTAFVAGLADRDRLTVVALRGEVLSGYLIGAAQPNLPGLLPPQIGVVLDLAVDSHGRGGGVGTEMFRLLSAWLRTRGIDRVEVRVAARNPIAQAFWRALGATEFYDTLGLKLHD